MPAGKHLNQHPHPHPHPHPTPPPHRPLTPPAKALKVTSVTSCANSVDQERDGTNVEDQTASGWCNYGCDADADIYTHDKKQAASLHRILKLRALLLDV